MKCPACGKECLYHPPTNKHACQDPKCVNAHGVIPSTPEKLIKDVFSKLNQRNITNDERRQALANFAAQVRAEALEDAAKAVESFPTTDEFDSLDPCCICEGAAKAVRRLK